jgi:DNA-binding SARP family transcriptional activator/tetratricopeptide (TPR) repeat protein
MEPLTIRLLGSPEVMVGQRPLAFPTRKALALLVYLVVEGGRPTRETLMALLWPESPPEKAAITLRGALSRLRQALQPAGEYILTQGTTVAFDCDAAHDLDLAWLDAAAYAELPAEELSPILSLDRGDFLEGFSLPDAPGFDTWAATRREACQRELETAYDRLSQHLLATHNSSAAADTAARWVARAPLSEQAYRRLMAAQALSGQRPAALRTYQRLQETLRQEMGLEPSRETAVLADNIGRGRLDEERPRPTVVAGFGPAAAAGKRLLLPLVGRADEHGRLVAAFQRTGQDGAQVVAVIGAAGAGKTRLVSAFQGWARLASPEAELWQGRAFETGGRLAYQPVVEALRPRLEAVNAPEDLLEDVWLAELSQLMPEIRARYPDLPPPMTGDAQFVRARLFEAVALLASALTAGRPAVLVLDDMQWAEADSLDLVHYLARRWAETGAPILLLLTIRQEAYAADASLREWLTSLGRDAPSTRLLLDSLSGAAVEQLVNRLAGGGADDATTSAFAAWLWAETRGLPFFIEALLQMLVEQGILPVTSKDQPIYDFAAALIHVRSVAQVPLPPGVREVVQARLAQHSKEVVALLLAAAVLGRTCSFERLCQVADLPETEALEALEVLLDGRLLVEQPADRRPYTTAHDYIREVVYSESREARRRVFHRRALLGLEAAGAPAAECAFHALAALLDEPAFRYSVAAGSEAFAAYAVQEALAHFDKAREVARRMDGRGEPVDMEALGRLYRHRGQALELIQDDGAAQANYEEMRATAEQHEDWSLELAALISLSNLHGTYTGVANLPKAKELAQEALAKAREMGDKAAEAGALCALTVAEFFSAGDNGQIMAYGQGTLALARELGLKELVGRTLNILCWPLVGEKQLEQAREVLSEAQAIWRELGNLPQLGEATRFMLIVHFIAGDHRRMLAEAPELDELGASTGGRLDRLNALMWQANVHVRQGRFGRALDYLEESGALSAAIGYANEEHGHMVGRLELYRAAGDLEEAEQWADRLHAQRETIMPSFTHYYLTGVAKVKIACGKLNESRAILDELLATLQADVPGSHIITHMAVAYAELRLAQGKPEALFARLEERIRPYREAGFNSLLADEYWLRGRAAMALGQYEAARAALLTARIAAEAQEERAILWKILATSSELDRACGDNAAAEKLRDQARAIVDDIAGHAGELRHAFLGQPAVAQLRGSTWQPAA